MTLALLLTAVTGAWADNVLYATVDGNTMTLMFGEKPDGAYVHDASNSNWATSFKYGIFTAVIDASCRNFDGNSTRYLFYKFGNISSIEGLSNLNTENVTQMDNMFEGCKPLTSIDLSNFNTAKVTSMAGMFNSCEALPSIDLSSFNTAKVTNMSYMFKNCSSLTTITVGEGWNTDKVTSSRYMFTSCSKLPNFNSGKTDKTNAFAGEGGYLTAASCFSINEAKTEASFEMPTYDVSFSYELVRDMSVQMQAKVGDDAAKEPRYRVQWNGERWVPADLNLQQVLALFSLKDLIEDKTLNLTSFNDSIYAVDAEGNPIGDAMTFQNFTFAPGRYCVTVTAPQGIAYEGTTAPSNIFELFQGYEITVGAGEYATFYKDENLYTKDEDAELYTIASVTESEAVLSDAITVAPANTPLLVYNKSEQDKTFLLIPTTDDAPEVTHAKEFKGSLTEGEIPASSAVTDYYALNGKAFVWVKYAIEIGANKCWLQIGDQPAAARAMTRSIVGGGNTTNMDDVRWQMEDGNYYDLQGRKVEKPNRKGIYIKGGKKVIVR